MNIPVGISACVLGQQVRFDGGHKRSVFVTDQLSQHFRFHPVCPEMAIGMNAPRPAIRLSEIDGEIRLITRNKSELDLTDKMIAFSRQKVASMSELCGYIVCAKSPSCGMERVKVHLANGQSKEGGGRGLFTEQLMTMMPWLPVEEDGRLNDPVLRENFVLRVFALHDLYQSTQTLSRRALIDFHSRYKYTLMAHSPVAYRALGQMVAQIHQTALEDFFIEYRLAFMNALKQRANRRSNTNVLQHLQGYFKRALNAREKEELTQVIAEYRQGNLPLLAALILFNHYLRAYPNSYLQRQAYLAPYPQHLKLRCPL
ncbi:DUF523 and DUF1722 domain-containing protein [Ferrimonas pelagia]